MSAIELEQGRPTYPPNTPPPPAGPTTPPPPAGPKTTGVDRALRIIRAWAYSIVLAVGLAGGIASPAVPADHRVTHFRDATPAESLLHDLYAERDLRAALREAAT